MANRLLPCPFCGCVTVTVRTNPFKAWNSGVGYTPSCFDCGATVPEQPTRELMEQKWNRRVQYDESALHWNCLHPIEQGHFNKGYLKFVGNLQEDRRCFWKWFNRDALEIEVYSARSFWHKEQRSYTDINQEDVW